MPVHSERIDNAPGEHELGETPETTALQVRAVLAARGILGACAELGLNRVTVLRIAAGARVKRRTLGMLTTRLAATHRAA